MRIYNFQYFLIAYKAQMLSVFHDIMVIKHLISGLVPNKAMLIK